MVTLRLARDPFFLVTGPASLLAPKPSRKLARVPSGVA